MGRQLNPIVVTSTGFALMPISQHSYPNTVDSFTDIGSLYKDYIGAPASYAGWAKAFDAYRRCSYCYGNFHQWARVQVSTLPLTDKAFDFIIDTIRYITTGRRQFQLSTWRILLATPPELQISDRCRSSRMYMLNIALETLPSNPIPMWCTHEGGLKDLIVTSAILFANLSDRPHP